MLKINSHHNFMPHLSMQPKHLIDQAPKTHFSLHEPSVLAKVLEPVVVEKETLTEDDEHWVLKSGISSEQLEGYLNQMIEDVASDPEWYNFSD